MSFIQWTFVLIIQIQLGFSVHQESEIVIQRNVLFLKAEVKTLKEKLDEKIQLWNEYKIYQSCLQKLEDDAESDNERCLESKNLIKILKGLETVTKSEKDVISRIIKKTEEIFPSQIFLVNGLDEEVENNAGEMKATMADILISLSSISRYDFSLNLETVNCNYSNKSVAYQGEIKWTLESKVEMCSNYSDLQCNIHEFILLPNGKIVNMVNNIVQVFLPNGTLLKRFATKFPAKEYVEGLIYWKESKILALTIPNNDGDLYEIDIETEKSSIFSGFYSMEVAQGISVVGRAIFACTYNGVLIAQWPNMRQIRRSRTSQYGLYNYKLYLYKSEYGSDYALFTGRLFHYQHVLLKSTGERMCSLPLRGTTKAVVAKNGMFVLVYYGYQDSPGGFQVYDKECDPVGDFVPHDPKYYVMDLQILNNTLVLNMETKDDDFKIKFVTYTFQT